MFRKFAPLSAAAWALAVAALLGAANAGEWEAAEVVSMKDFDELEVKLSGKTCKAFLVGLRPLRQGPGTKEERERIREKAVAELKKSDLFAQVVTRRGEAVGLALDAFAHKRNGFGHPWDPQKYSYCVTGWGAYNFNLYFLHRRYTAPEDNFGDNKYWRDLFRKAEKGKGSEEGR